MEFPAALKCAAVATELVGTAFGLITNINQALEKARQNKADYQHLKQRLPTIGYVLHRLPPDPELEPLLAPLINMLQEAYDVLVSCQKRSSTNQLIRASIHADRLRLVNDRIDSHLLLFPVICYAAIARRLDDKPSCSCAGSQHKLQDVCKILEIVPINHTSEVRGCFSAGCLQDVDDAFVAEREGNHTSKVPGCSSAGSMQNWEDVLVAELKPIHTSEVPMPGSSSTGSMPKWEEALVAEGKPNNTGEVPGCSYSGSMQNWEDVLMAKLKPSHTGEVPVPGSSSAGSMPKWEEALLAEGKPNNTSEVPGYSSAGSMQNWEDLLVAGLKPNNMSEVPGSFSADSMQNWEDPLFAERHTGEVPEVGMIVYEQGHMNNTLKDHLVHGVWSPVTESWRTRLEVLLGASRGVEHMHRCAIIHGNVSSSNILPDANWKPRLSGFLGVHVLQAGQLVVEVVDLEYRRTGLMSPTCDVYSFGIVILEALTGRLPVSGSWGKGEDVVTLADSTLSFIQGGNLRAVLDGRPVLQPMIHLDALNLMAHTAMLCLSRNEKDRPPISSVTVNLEGALRIMRNNGPMNVLRV
ncbi:hypothetical protein VPH35_041871 [Triticum aestivum]